MSWPTVTAVLLLERPEQRRLAQQAVRQFLGQTYAAKRLLLLNTTGEPLWQEPPPTVSEQQIAMTPPPTPGALYNLALRQIPAGYVKPWPVDDLFDPFLLAYQLGCLAAQPGYACLLGQQIRVHLPQQFAYLHTPPGGIATTICHPAAPFLLVDEDDPVDPWSSLASRWQQQSLVPSPVTRIAALQVSMYHAYSVWPESRWLGEQTPLPSGTVHLPALELNALYFRLADCGIRLRLLPQREVEAS